MNERRRLISGVVFATIVFLIVLGIRPVATDRIVAGYVILLAAIVLLALVRIGRSGDERGRESAFEHAIQQRTFEPMRPPELVRMEREITLGQSRAGYLHERLLPTLREAAATRLATRRSVDLERRPDEARRILGDDVWDLLRPDRPEPVDKLAPGISLGALRRIVDSLEQI
jgi:hypothetical protein